MPNQPTAPDPRPQPLSRPRLAAGPSPRHLRRRPVLLRRQVDEDLLQAKLRQPQAHPQERHLLPHRCRRRSRRLSRLPPLRARPYRRQARPAGRRPRHRRRLPEGARRRAHPPCRSRQSYRSWPPHDPARLQARPRRHPRRVRQGTAPGEVQREGSRTEEARHRRHLRGRLRLLQPPL